MRARARQRDAAEPEAVSPPPTAAQLEAERAAFAHLLKGRECYEGERQLLPELTILGFWHLPAAYPNKLLPGRHPGEYEIHYFVSGATTFWAGEERYEVRPGMVSFTQPGELHGGVDATLQPGEWYWLRFRPPASGRPLPEMSAASTEQLKRELSRIHHHAFAGSEQLKSCFARLMEEHRQRPPLAATMARLILHELLLTVIRDHARWQAQPTGSSPFVSAPIQQVVHWLREHLAEPLPRMDDIAARVGLSGTTFRRRFAEEMGFSPLEYVTRVRVEQARQLLAGGPMPLNEIAMRLGFQSASYFTQVFRKVTGMTPTDYRARHSA